MRDDLISRQAAIEAIDAVFPVDPMKSEYAQGIACGAALAKTYVEQLPSAQLERNKGKWIVDVLADNIYRCSECGVDAPVEPTGGTEYKSNYCPNCGAKMEGETE